MKNDKKRGKTPNASDGKIKTKKNYPLLKGTLFFCVRALPYPTNVRGKNVGRVLYMNFFIQGTYLDFFHRHF